MRTLLSAILVAVMLMVPGAKGQAPAPPQLPAETAAQKEARLAWWTDARFGMFIHWGLYAQAARHEWVKKNERMTDAAYQKYFDTFDPDLYDPREWARQAKRAGMKYAVITTKHHEGFCLWDSQFTDYKATNTPARRDLLKAWVEAFRAEGLRVGFYYSLLDWHHPSYTIDRNHPQSASTDADYEKLNAGRDMAVYRQYLKDQVRELLTNYGKIDVIWLDFSFTGGRVRQGARRLGLGRAAQDGPRAAAGDHRQRPPRPARRARRLGLQVARAVQAGRVGEDERRPRAVGDLPDVLGFVGLLPRRDELEGLEAADRAADRHGQQGRQPADERRADGARHVRRARAGPAGGVRPLDAGERPRHLRQHAGARRRSRRRRTRLLTYNPKTNRLYVHLLAWPMGELVLPGYADKVKYAQLLHDASEAEDEHAEGARPGSARRRAPATSC